MFKRLNLKNIFIKKIITCSLISVLIIFCQPISLASAYEGIRVTANNGKECSEDTEEHDCFVDGICNKDLSQTERNKCYSSDYDVAKQSCEVGDMYFNPFGRDVDWELSNDHCISYITTTGIALGIAFMVCDSMCVTAPTPAQNFKSLIDSTLKPAVESSRLTQIMNKAKDIAQTAGNLASGSASASLAMATTVIDPLMIGKIGIYTARCANILSVVDSTACCTAASACGISYASAIAILGAIFEVSKNAFHSTRICGDGTKIWKNTGDSSKKVWSKDDNNYFKCLRYFFGGTDTKPDFNFNTIDGSINRPSARLNELKRKYFPTSTNCEQNTSETAKQINEQFYREYLFNGIEYEDNGDGACDNPTGEGWDKVLGYLGGKQRYYFRGAPEEPQFACSRFLDKGINDKEGFEAYKCCKKRARDTICLEQPKRNHYKFCSASGPRCSFEATDIDTLVTYQIYESFTDPRYLCAKTYSVCPYNHLVGGGTEEVDKDYWTSTISNFCQVRRHCIKKPPTSDIPKTSISDSFFSEACVNRKGDSQFIHKLENIKSPIPIKSRNFSAPIVQCLKESLENNFFQIAGRDICANKTDVVYNGKCKSIIDGSEKEISIKKGQKLQTNGKNNDTIFVKIQQKFRLFVKLAMILAVTMLGYQILIASPEVFLNKKTVLLFLLKFGLVAFFALSTSWHSMFLNQILRISDELSVMTFFPSPKSDGCNFPKYNGDNLQKLRQDGNGYDFKEFEVDYENDSKNNIPSSYPVGKSYLRIWDTLDCKLSRALGYGPDVNAENFTKMIFAGFLTGPLGITFVFASLAYGFMLISIILRTIHIVIMSLVGVILLIFISPLTITCALFERTKGIFENWYKQLMGFILQPMILFAYLGVLLTIFDNVFLGDAKFITPSDPITKKLVQSLPTIDCTDNNNIKPSETSIYCIFQFNKFKKYTGLEVFNLAIPVLMDLNKEKINTIIKAAVILFVFYQFLDKITYLAKKLVGGSELKPDAMPNIQGKLKQFARGVQKRALNASKNFAIKGSKKVARMAVNNGSESTKLPDMPSSDSAGSINNTSPSNSASPSNNDSSSDSANSTNTDSPNNSNMPTNDSAGQER